VVKRLYLQQKEMFDGKKHSVANRIVSIRQPHVRPIVRGKARAKTEFGAKVEITVVGGYVRLEKFSWDAYNESTSLIPAIQSFRKQHGHYPERVLADKLYRNRENLRFCREHGIRMSGPALGRPSKKETVDKKAEYLDSCGRNIVEGKFGESKNKYGLDRVKTRTPETSKCDVMVAIITMNLMRLLRETDKVFHVGKGRGFQKVGDCLFTLG
jgi:hypothetical protein